jgi:serine protease Do
MLRSPRFTSILLMSFAGLTLAVPASFALAKPSDAAQTSLSEAAQIAAARDKVFPALVNIRTISLNYFSGKESKSASVGSGTIISTDGHIVTNAHVIDRGVKFKVTLSDKSEVDATLVGEDPLTDLAVLKIDPATAFGGKTGGKLPTAEWGDSNALEAGQTVIAMGSPFSLSRSVTVGVISNTERVFSTGFTGDSEIEEDDLGGQATGTFTRWLQHDALINPGNSGGPLVNLQGQIIGINTRGGSGMGFASPSYLAKDVVRRLIADGEVIRSTAGLQFKSIARTGIERGVLVNSVADNPPGPAAKAGLRPGDVIIKMNTEEVTARFVEQIPSLMRQIADMPVGTAINITYLRDGKEATTTLTTERLLRDRGEETALRAWGVSVTEITERYAREARLKDPHGIIITGVRGGSPSALAEPPLQGGDIIRAIGGEPIKSVNDAVARYRAIMSVDSKDKIPEFLMLEVDRNGTSIVTLIKPRPQPKEDPPREVPKAWIGVAVQPVLRDLSRQLGLEGQTGFRVTRIYSRTAAAQSELKVGDIITAVGDDKVSPRTLQDAGLFQRTVRNRLKISEPVTLKVIRDGKPVEVTVMADRTQIGPEEARKDENKDFEISVREITFFDRDDNRWDDSVQGVIVEGTEQGGWAGQGGLSFGDLIIAIDGKPVTDITTYRTIMEDLAKRQPERVVFKVLQGINTSHKFVEPDWKPTVTGEKPGEAQADPKPDAKPAGN